LVVRLLTQHVSRLVHGSDAAWCGSGWTFFSEQDSAPILIHCLSPGYHDFLLLVVKWHRLVSFLHELSTGHLRLVISGQRRVVVSSAYAVYFHFGGGHNLGLIVLTFDQSSDVHCGFIHCLKLAVNEPRMLGEIGLLHVHRRF
jgi:hypothetical protein